jgi:hypothetical protein
MGSETRCTYATVAIVQSSPQKSVGIRVLAAVVTTAVLDSSNAAKHPYTSKNQHASGSKTKQAKPQSNVTTARQQVIGSAQDYLANQAFSRVGLIGQLSSKYGEQITRAQAQYGAK